MTTSTRASVLALSVAVIAAMMIGTLTGGNEAGAATQHTLRIPASAFRPVTDAIDYSSGVQGLQYQGATNGSFEAPVLLEGNTATILSIKLHYRDNGSGQVCMEMVRTKLTTGATKTMSSLCTRNATYAVRTRMDTTIDPNKVRPYEAVSVKVNLPPWSYNLVGVTVVYTSDQ